MTLPSLDSLIYYLFLILGIALIYYINFLDFLYFIFASSCTVTVHNSKLKKKKKLYNSFSRSQSSCLLHVSFSNQFGFLMKQISAGKSVPWKQCGWHV